MIVEVLADIYSKLDAALAVEVGNNIEQDYDTYPFVVLEQPDLDEDDTDSETGFQGIFQVHVWSKSKSDIETMNLQKTIYDTLHRLSYDTTNYGVSDIHQQSVRILREPDGITRHGVQRFVLSFEPLPPPP